MQQKQLQAGELFKTLRKEKTKEAQGNTSFFIETLSGFTGSLTGFVSSILGANYLEPKEEMDLAKFAGIVVLTFASGLTGFFIGQKISQNQIEPSVKKALESQNSQSSPELMEAIKETINNYINGQQAAHTKTY